MSMAGGAQEIGAALHHRGRLAAYRDRRRWSRTRCRAKATGFGGSKIKVGRPPHEDVARLAAVREAVGAGFEIMTDANQALHRRRGDPPRAALRAARHRLVRGAAAGRRRRRPCPPVRLDHAARSRSARSSTAICISATICSAAPARSCRSTSARIGGITPWLKIAHLAETFNVAGLPAFPDGAACRAVLRRAERRAGSNTSRSSTT